jgi:hypothetical protein
VSGGLNALGQKMTIFHVGMFILISTFLSTFIIIGIRELDDVSIAQASASISIQFVIAQGTKYLQKLTVLMGELQKLKKDIEAKFKKLGTSAKELVDTTVASLDSPTN